MLTRTTVTDDQLAALVAPLGDALRSEPLSGGMFASVFAVDLAPRPGVTPDDVPGRVVVKVTGADTSRLLRYEHGTPGTEAAAYRAAHAAGLPVPQVLHADLTREHVDGDALVVTFLDGTLWSAREDDAAESAAVRRGLGSFMARLHRIAGDRFGYPAPASGLAAATWPDALARMVDAVLDDARTWGVELPEARVRDAVARHPEVLARVEVPRLVHADLWPLFELAGADQLGAGPVDADLLAGYAAEGGDLGLGDGTPGSGDPAAWTRLRRTYLSCLLAVEVVPRGYEGDWVEGYAGTARANLLRMLDELGV